jgi:hypothetical protein
MSLTLLEAERSGLVMNEPHDPAGGEHTHNKHGEAVRAIAEHFT